MVQIRYYLVPKREFFGAKNLGANRFFWCEVVFYLLKSSRIVQNLFKIGSLLRYRYVLVRKPSKPYIQNKILVQKELASQENSYVSWEGQQLFIYM